MVPRRVDGLVHTTGSQRWSGLAWPASEKTSPYQFIHTQIHIKITITVCMCVYTHTHTERERDDQVHGWLVGVADILIPSPPESKHQIPGDTDKAIPSHPLAHYLDDDSHFPEAPNALFDQFGRNKVFFHEPTAILINTGIPNSGSTPVGNPPNIEFRCESSP